MSDQSKPEFAGKAESNQSVEEELLAKISDAASELRRYLADQGSDAATAGPEALRSLLEATERVGKTFIERATDTAADIAGGGAGSGVVSAPPAPMHEVARAVGSPAAESDITDEIEKGGPALGAFVKAVGLAVAAGQEELDKTLVSTAKALSEQRINVISVFEQILTDEGRMSEGKTIESTLPLITYLMPTAYAWSRVYLEADMDVKEFNARNGLNIQRSSLGVYARANASWGFGFSGGASAGFGYSSSNLGIDSSASTDEAAGKLHLEATLEPRTDVQLPRPYIVQKGPRILLNLGEITDVTSTPGQPAVGRKVRVGILVQKEDGSPNSGKSLSIRVEPAGLEWTTEAGGTTVGADGKLNLDLVRKGALFDDGAPPVDARVAITLGLVSESVSVRF